MESNNKENKLRVLHLLGTPGIGGIEKLVLDLSILQRDDATLEPGIYFTLHSTQTEFKPAFEKTGIAIFYGDFKSGFDVSLKKISYSYRLFKQYDVLHIHTFSPIIALVAVISRKKIIFTDHGVHGLGRAASLMDKVKHKLERIFLNRYVDYIIFNSKFTEEASRKRFSISNTDTRMIYNGVTKGVVSDTEEIDKAVGEKIQNKFVVGTSSRFASFKKIERLIEAFSIYQQDKETILLLVGDGPEMQNLKDQVLAHDLSDRVIFSGYRPNVTVYQQAMDVCVFPSQSEPFGLVAVEGLSLGKPVVVFRDGGGIVEIVSNFSTDDVVNDVGDLAKRLTHYYNNGALSQEEVVSRMTYADTFSSAKMASEYKEVYIDMWPNLL